jgi:hypothetical protein
MNRPIRHDDNPGPTGANSLSGLAGISADRCQPEGATWLRPMNWPIRHGDNPGPTGANSPSGFAGISADRCRREGTPADVTYRGTTEQVAFRFIENEADHPLQLRGLHPLSSSGPAPS